MNILSHASSSAQCVVDILTTRRDMLAEYFSLGISSDGAVESLPLLLHGYTPNLDRLPSFLMRLGAQVRHFQVDDEGVLIHSLGGLDVRDSVF
jgi:hypothetical protein